VVGFSSSDAASFITCATIEVSVTSFCPPGRLWPGRMGTLIQLRAATVIYH
jgi:hypothetical protein